MNRIDPLRTAAACAAAALGLALAACASGTANNRAYQAKSTPASVGHAGCFDPANARGFTPVGDDVLLVDTGNNHYRVQLDATCFGTDFAPAMQFRGDSISGRVCGRFGDAVFWSHHECQIQRVDWITPQEYDGLKNPPKKQDAATSGQ